MTEDNRTLFPKRILLLTTITLAILLFGGLFWIGSENDKDLNGFDDPITIQSSPQQENSTFQSTAIERVMLDGFSPTSTAITHNKTYKNIRFGYQFEYPDGYFVTDDGNIKSWIASTTISEELKEALLFQYEVLWEFGDVAVFNESNPNIAFVISPCSKKNLSECVDDAKKRWSYDASKTQTITIGKGKIPGLELSMTLNGTQLYERNERLISFLNHQGHIFEIDFHSAPDRYPEASQDYYIVSYYSIRDSFSF